MVDETVQGDHGDALALLALALYARYHMYEFTYTPPPAPPAEDRWDVHAADNAWYHFSWAKASYPRDVVITLPSRVAGQVPGYTHGPPYAEISPGEQDSATWTGPFRLRMRIRVFDEGGYRYLQRWDPVNEWVTLWRKKVTKQRWEYVGPTSGDVVLIGVGPKIGAEHSGRPREGIVRRLPVASSEWIPGETYIIVEGCESNNHLRLDPNIYNLRDYNDRSIGAGTDLPAIPGGGKPHLQWNSGVDVTSAQILKPPPGDQVQSPAEIMMIGENNLGVLALDYDFLPPSGAPPGSAFTPYDRGESGLTHAGANAVPDPAWLTEQEFVVWEFAPQTYAEADAAIAAMGDLIGLPAQPFGYSDQTPWLDAPYVIDDVRQWPREKIPYTFKVYRPRVFRPLGGGF